MQIETHLAEQSLKHQQMLDTVRQYIADQDWHAKENHHDNGIAVFELNFSMTNGNLRVFFDVKGDEDRFGVYAYSPLDVPENFRAEVAQYICRVNWKMFLGKLSMDMEDGELRMTTTVNVGESQLSMAMISVMENITIVSMDRYLGGVMSIIYGGLSAKAAYEKAESAGEHSADVSSDTKITRH